MNNEIILKILQNITFLNILLSNKQKEQKESEFLKIIPQTILQGYKYCVKELKKEYKYIPEETYHFYWYLLTLFPKENSLASIDDIQSAIFYYLQILDCINEAYKNSKLNPSFDQGYME